MIKIAIVIAVALVVMAFADNVLGQPETKPSKAIIETAQGSTKVAVTLGKEFSSISGKPTGYLFSIDKNKNETQVTTISDTIPFRYRTFEIDFPNGSYDPSLSYEVLVFVSSQTHEGKPITLKKSIKVSGLFIVEITRQDNCDGLTMIIRTTERNRPDLWIPIYSWLEQFVGDNAHNLAAVNITVPTVAPNKLNAITEVRWKKSDVQVKAGQLRACVLFKDPLPAADFTGIFQFHGPNLPPSISTASGEELGGSVAVDFPPIDQDIDSVSKRKLERNLDLGVTLTSEVADKTVDATATAPSTTVRQRTSRGVLDLRFAPWMDILHPPVATNKWLHHLTPLVINANVSTGKIDEETLSLNRILIGVEGESRYIRRHDFTPKGGELGRVSYPVWHRVIWGFTHASDRDFKQKEFTAKIEYKPVFDKLYRPYGINHTVDKDGFKHWSGWGLTFLPEVGFEIGRTYSRRNPAEVIKPSDTVKRFYFGGELSLDITEFVTLSAADYFYVRGENRNDHFKNYFKSTGEFRLGRSLSGSFAHSLFVVFERGQQPPFSSPDVNSLRIGYRIQGNYCGTHCR